MGKRCSSRIRLPKGRWCVYLLRCSDGSLYCGVTTDLAARIAKHNEGQGAKYTRSRLPVRLAYAEVAKSRSEALRREHEIKGLSKREKEALCRHRRRAGQIQALRHAACPVLSAAPRTHESGNRTDHLKVSTMPRLGLCCIFRDQPIKFAVTTATAIGRMDRADAFAKLARLCGANAQALLAALRFCADHGIGCFRVNSQILPLKTHQRLGYGMNELPHGEEIVRCFKECGAFARTHALRTCFHPDQFVVLNSQRPDVVTASIRELEYQAEVAEWIGADVLNVHGGGAFGDKQRALADFAHNLDRLSSRVRSRLTVENDDRIFTPADLLPVCRAVGIPLVYDVHHHRCNGDDLSTEEATDQAMATWNREPVFHISSPIEGWKGPRPERHHEFIDVKDFPEWWLDLNVTVEVEAKAKEVAVLKLKKELERRRRSTP